MHYSARFEIVNYNIVILESENDPVWVDPERDVSFNDPVL